MKPLTQIFRLKTNKEEYFRGYGFKNKKGTVVFIHSFN